MRRSTRFRRRYIALLKGPCRFMFLRLGMVARIPRLRKKVRTGWPQYPLSPTRRPGLFRGRPRPGRLTAPLDSNAGTCLDSAAWPGVRTSVMSLPPPSARRCTLVLNPPRLRPKASAPGVVFLPQLHVDERELSSHPQNGLPNPAHLPGLLPLAAPPEPGPRHPRRASGKTDWQLCAISRTEWANHARVHLCAGPKECH